jgi:Rab9 effector protein with kelch motifs
MASTALTLQTGGNSQQQQQQQPQSPNYHKGKLDKVNRLRSHSLRFQMQQDSTASKTSTSSLLQMANLQGLTQQQMQQQSGLSTPTSPFINFQFKTPFNANGIMRWTQVKAHFMDDGSQLFLPIRSPEVIHLNERCFIHGDVDKDINVLIRFDLVSMCWSLIRQRGEVPPAARAHSLTYIGNNQAIMFGGGRDMEYYDSLYLLDLTSFYWKRIVAAGKSPRKRRAHASCFDKLNSRLYIFGGGDGEQALNDCWMLETKDGNFKWEEIKFNPSTNTAPTPRGYPTMNYVDEKLLVFGGSDGQRFYNDLHVFDLASGTWNEVLQIHGCSRMGHSSHMVGNYLFILGGYNGSQFTNDMLVVNLLNFQMESKPIAGGNKMIGRAYHKGILYDSRLFLFCGFDGVNCLNDVWVLDLASQAFLPRIPNFKISMEQVVAAHISKDPKKIHNNLQKGENAESGMKF